MEITVHYLAQLKRAAGVATENVTVEDGCSLSQVLKGLADRHGPAFRAGLLDEHGQPLPALLFFLGAEQVRPDSARPLCEGDEVTILSPMSGG